jgi:phosphoglucomutase
VIASVLIAEMALYYKEKGMTLYDALMKLYAQHGAMCDILYTHEAKGAAGAAQIRAWMADIRRNYKTCLAGEEIVAIEDVAALQRRDLKTGEKTKINLPKSDVVKLFLADGSWLVLRPSGTEPKIKLYICTDRAFGPGSCLDEANARGYEILEKAKAMLV